MKLLCWLMRHKLICIARSPNGELEKLHCTRCKRYYAMFHPTKWFGEWDHQDEQVLKELRRSKVLGS